MLNWDDFRIFLAAARAGSLVLAGQRLGIDAATVGRRIARLESALKATLLVRAPAGLQLTAMGVRLADIGEDAEALMRAMADVVRSDVVGGTVRISAAEGFGTTLLAPALPALREARPALSVELAAIAGILSAGRREVDIAVALSPPADSRLLVEPLTEYHLALYASADYLDRKGCPSEVEDLRRFDIVGYVDDLIYAPELRYLDEMAMGLRPALASSSIRAQREIVLKGGGIAVLPCFMAQDLVRVLAPAKLVRRFWMATHRDVADTARIKFVRNWLKALVADSRALLTPIAAD